MRISLIGSTLIASVFLPPILGSTGSGFGSAALASHLAEQATPHVGIASQIGITPELVIVAGFDGTSVTTMLSRLEAATTERQAVEACHAACDAANTEAAARRATYLASPDEEGVRQHYETAMAAAATARENLRSALDDLFEVVTDGLNGTWVAKLEAIRLVDSIDLPPQFLALSLTEPQKARLQAALRAEQRAQRRGEALETHYAELLADLRGEPVVQQAQTRLSQMLATIEGLFEE